MKWVKFLSLFNRKKPQQTKTFVATEYGITFNDAEQWGKFIERQSSAFNIIFGTMHKTQVCQN